ncbi:MAG: YqaJ viral recombinase family protein [Patescibacteria group bacterium]|nr:YqaJ viral recombinase family protein [Patescibacteria group bacterium]
MEIEVKSGAAPHRGARIATVCAAEPAACCCGDDFADDAVNCALCDNPMPEPRSAAVRAEDLAALSTAIRAALKNWAKSLEVEDEKQRSAKWYETMATTIGGSEIAAVMGCDPYKKYADIVASKLGIGKGFSGGVACWWGSMFEDVAARVIEIDCATEVVGDELCLRKLPHHRFSPDGYCVVGLYWDGGTPRIWTPVCGRDAEIWVMAIIETKCPLRRVPGRVTPRQYRPQVRSGIALSPHVALGVFIDAVFRKCSVLDLGASANYDTDYHRDKKPWAGAPFAWGLIGVYAPTLNSPPALRVVEVDTILAGRGPAASFGEFSATSDCAVRAWELNGEHFAMRPNQKELIDFGDATAAVFDAAMGMIDKKRFQIRALDPCLHDGRGSPLQTAAGVRAAIDDLRAAPAHHLLIGVLPWKLFELNYIPESSPLAFTKDIARLAAEVFEHVAKARASGRPHEYLATLAASKTKNGEGPAAGGLDQGAVQDFLNSL